jgi:hypothetical protein
MKIYVLNKVLEYENDEELIPAILEKLEDIVEKSNCALSYLQIDGQDVHKDFDDYLLDNIDDIKEIKVVTKTIRDLEKEMLQSAGEYLEETIPKVETLSYEFFKEPTNESFIKLIELFRGIRWLVEIFELVDSNCELKYIVNSYETWNLYAKDIYSLQEIIEDFSKIFDEDDLTFIPEILHDEVAPLFRDMQNKLDILVHRKVDESALN